MSQDEYYQTLLSLMKDLRSERATWEILNQPKVAEENFDKAATLDDEKLQTQKEDGRDKNVTSNQSPLSDKSAKFDEGMSQSKLAASGSGKSQDVGEASNEDSLNRQQKWMDLFADYEYSIPIPRCEKSYSLYRSCLNLFYEGQYEKAKTICEIILEELLKGTRTNGNDLEIIHFMKMLASIYRKTNRYDDAIILLFKALEIHAVNPVNDHRVISIALNNLGICHAMVGNYAKAHKFCGYALQILLKDGDVILLARQFYCLGALYQMQDQYDSAEGFYVKAQASYLVLLKDEHPELKKVVRNLTTCYLMQEKVKEAKALQKRY